jgi:hypothetical protein
MPKRILILYEARSTFTATVREYLEAFPKYSAHEIWFAVGTRGAPLLYDLAQFDVVVIHYSVRLCIDWYLSQEYAAVLRRFEGLKIAMVQDEYEDTDVLRASLTRLGIDVLFTCVPGDQVEKVYPRAQFPNMEFVQVLTGYVPEAYEHGQEAPDPADRPILIGYRGRPLPYWYGALGQEKIEIGRRMAPLCDARGLTTDIKWGNDDRIYGNAWYDFVRACRVMLGTESGANVFDDRGEIRKGITEALAFIPDLTFAEAAQMFIGAEEGRVVMNQVSPKVFEAIAFRTGLVLFEGNYSGVLLPERHFIPLKKDFSNVDDVLAKVQDAGYVRELTARAYREVIETGTYGYRAFVKLFDDTVARHPRRAAAGLFDVAAVRAAAPGRDAYYPTREVLDDSASKSLPPHPGPAWQTSTLKTLARQSAKRAWFTLPRALRLRLWPALRKARQQLNRR